MNAQMEEMHKTRYVERSWNIMYSLKYPCVHQPTSSLNPVSRGLQGLITQASLIKSMAIGVNSISSPSSLPEVQGTGVGRVSGGMRFQLSNHMFDFISNQPPFLTGFQKSHSLSLTKDNFMFFSHRKLRVQKLCDRNGDKNQIYIFLL